MPSENKNVSNKSFKQKLESLLPVELPYKKYFKNFFMQKEYNTSWEFRFKKKKRSANNIKNKGKYNIFYLFLITLKDN